MRVAALTSAVRTAVRARERQYQIRGHLAERVRTEESLRAADQRKDEFLATLGHELRNPLAPILTSMHLLKLSTFTDPRSVRACTVLERQVNHLVRLVDDLLEVSRITRGVMDVQKEPLDLVSVLRTAVETSRPLLEGARQALSVDIPDADHSDFRRPRPADAGLCEPAEQRVEVHRHERPHLAVGLAGERMGGRVGARQRHRHPVFAPDERVRHVYAGRSIPSPGAGRARDRPDARSESRAAARRDGRSTKWRQRDRQRVHRSAAVAAERPRPRGEVTRSQRLPPCRILIVDDNREAAESLGVLLEELGATTSLAFGGREALQVIETFEPEVVLWTSGCQGWTATRSAAGSARCPVTSRRWSWRSRDGGRTKIGNDRDARASITISSSR